MSHLAKARQVFDIEVAALKAVRQQLDAAFDVAVKVIVESLKQRGKIVIVGIGKSGNVGQKIAATLTSTGSTAVVLNSVDALHGDVGIVNDGDVILALSYSGESEELLDLLPALKRFSVKIIAFRTGNLKSGLARHCDAVAECEGAEGSVSVQPRANLQHDGDAGQWGMPLAMAVLEARGFTQKKILRKYHPSGAI